MCTNYVTLDLKKDKEIARERSDLGIFERRTSANNMNMPLEILTEQRTERSASKQIDDHRSRQIDMINGVQQIRRVMM